MLSPTEVDPFQSLANDRFWEGQRVQPMIRPLDFIEIKSDS
jgi:hypothetical protein